MTGERQEACIQETRNMHSYRGFGKSMGGGINARGWGAMIFFTTKFPQNSRIFA